MNKDDMFFIEKENNYIKWVILLSLVLIVLAFFSYLYYKLSPKEILVSTIDEVKYLVNTNKEVNYKIDLDYEVFTQDERVNKFLDYLNMFDISLEVNSNLKDNLYSEVILNYNNKETYNLSSYYYKDNLYVNALDRLYKFDNIDKYKDKMDTYFKVNKSFSLDSFIDNLVNSINEENVSRKFVKNGLILSITLDEEFYKKNNINQYKFNKAVITYKLDKFKLNISEVNLISQDYNIDILLNNNNYTIDVKSNNEVILKVVLERINKDSYKVVVQYDKVGLLLSMNVKIDKCTYKEVSINTDNARNISEFNIDDINYFVSLLVNSEVFGEVINLEGGNEE